MTGQIIFVIWRESIEALLVIGILYSWLGRNADAARGRRYLWGGVLAGLITAAVMAYALMRLNESFSDTARQYLSTTMVFIAAVLIVQMVVWMRAHGRHLKRDLEQGLDAAASKQRWSAVFLLAMLAVAREGSETVVFLFGILASGHGGELVMEMGAIGIGFGAALLTFAGLQLGSWIMPWRWFFKLSEAMLLLLGCSLTVTGMGNLVSLGLLPYTAILWDSSAILSDTTSFGGLIAALSGYRALPDAVTLATWLAYGAVVAFFLWRPHRVRRVATNAEG